MTPEEFAYIAARIETCGELSGMEYEDAIDRIALQDAPRLLAEVRRLQEREQMWLEMRRSLYGLLDIEKARVADLERT